MSFFAFKRIFSGRFWRLFFKSPSPLKESGVTLIIPMIRVSLPKNIEASRVSRIKNGRVFFAAKRFFGSLAVAVGINLKKLRRTCSGFNVGRFARFLIRHSQKDLSGLNVNDFFLD